MEYPLGKIYSYLYRDIEQFIKRIKLNELNGKEMLEIDETFKLTEETMKLATLAGLDFKEATSQMTSA